MPTLHNVTENTKKVLKIGGIIVLSIVSIILLFRGGIFLKDYFFPTPPPPPTVTFGELPPVEFPESVSKDLTFEIDTVTGSLPAFTDSEGALLDRVVVYKIFNPSFSLLDLQNTKNTVSEVGFFGQEVPLGDNIYQWSTVQAGLQKVIEMNIVNKSFTYASPFREFDRVLEAENMPDRPASVARSKTFLESMNLFPSDIDETKTQTELLRIQGQELLPADTLREAQVIRVNFFQQDINELPIYYEEPPYSSITFYVASGERFDSDIVQAEYMHQFITEEVATYPIKPVEVAYEELQQGLGYIGANFRNEPHIKVKDVELGYYASSSYQEYLVPVYIFKGLSDEFYAYVPAVANEWFGVENRKQTEQTGTQSAN